MLSLKAKAGRAKAVCAAVLAVLSVGLGAHAEQFLMFDTLVVHELMANPPYKGWHSHLNLVFAPGIPTNWNTPVDYYNGTAYFRLELFEKPAARTTLYQICINRSASLGEWHSCMQCLDAFTEPGVYWTEQSPSTFWFYQKPNYANFVGGYPQLVLKGDPKGGCSCPVTSGGLAQFHCWDGYPDMNLYYPMRMRATAYVVAKGSSFEAPEFWDDSALNDPTAALRAPPSVVSTAGISVRSAADGGVCVYGVPERCAIQVVSPRGRVIDVGAATGGSKRISLGGRGPGVYIIRIASPTAGYSVKVPCVQ